MIQKLILSLLLVLPLMPCAAGAGNGSARAIEALVQRFSKDEVNEMLGFFAPVVKKYRPTFLRFNREYLAAKEKLPVIAKYMPQASLALGDARAMRVPARYEQQKQNYLRIVETLLASIRLIVTFGS